MSFEPTSVSWDQNASVWTATLKATQMCVDPRRVDSWLSNMDMEMLYSVWAKMDERTCL